MMIRYHGIKRNNSILLLTVILFYGLISIKDMNAAVLVVNADDVEFDEDNDIVDLDDKDNAIEVDTEDQILEPLQDTVDDGIYDPFNYDASCVYDTTGDQVCDGWSLPESTIEVTEEAVNLTEFTKAVYGGDDPDDDEVEGDSAEKVERSKRSKVRVVDKHWGSDEKVLKLRDALRKSGQLGGKRIPTNNSKRWKGKNANDEKSRKSNQRRRQKVEEHKNPEDDRLQENLGRPPIFLMPGLASTRLVSWANKACQHPLVSDIKMHDYIWLNVKVSSFTHNYYAVTPS